MEAITEMRNPMLPGSDEAGVEQKERVSIVDFKMVTFSLAGKDYAIDIMKVKEIAKAGHFTYVPNTLPFVLGVYNLRGDIIPIIDLRRFFNIEVPEREKDALENMLIVSVEDQPFGVVVDVIDKVVGIQESSIQPPHPLLVISTSNTYTESSKATIDCMFCWTLIGFLEQRFLLIQRREPKIYLVQKIEFRETFLLQL